jgi:arylsulfatase
MFVYDGAISGLPTSISPNIIGRSYKLTAEVEVPEGGGDGMIVTSGGRWGGWGLYMLKGKPVFDYNMLVLAQYRWEGPDALTSGKHTIDFDYTYDGPGIAKGGTGILSVDGKAVVTKKQPNSIAFLAVGDETFDVGMDTRTGVNDADYQVPFKFDGKIDKLAVNLGPLQIVGPDKAKADAAAATGGD